MDELAALKTESGIRNWHLMVPNWIEGTFMIGKGRRKHERQLEREVRMAVKGGERRRSTSCLFWAWRQEIYELVQWCVVRVEMTSMFSPAMTTLSESMIEK